MNINNTIGVRFTGDAQDLLNTLKQGEAGVAGFSNKVVSASGSAVKGFDTTTMSAKQLAFSLRGLPAQMTDIVTSLQGGQRPLTVLLQQGGQLKDMFGGIGPAARAMGGYIAGLVNPYTLAAVAAGGLAIAWYQGTKEAQNYNKALILTGNIAGTTAGQMADMARELGKSGYIQSDAAAAIADLAQSGAVAGSELKKLAGIALDTEKATGQSVAKTADIYKELEKAPLQASIKLNNEIHHLTLTTYEHIKSLEEQGKKAAAGSVAINAYADVMAGRNKQMIENNGYLERSWNAVTAAIKDAGSWMMNIGRADTESVQLAALKEKRAQIESEKWKYDGGGESGKLAYDKATKALDQRIAGIEGAKAAEQKVTEEQVKQSKLVQLKSEWDRDDIQFRSNKKKLALELTETETKYQGLLASGAITAKEYADRLADVRNKYKGGAGPVDPFAGVLKGILERTAASKLELEQELKLTAGQQLAAKVMEDVRNGTLKLTAAKAALLGESLKEMLLAEQATGIRAAEIKATQDANQERQKYLDTTVKETLSLQEQILRQQDHNATIGMTEAAIAALTARRELDKASTLESIAIKRLDRNLDYQEYETTMALVKAMRELAGEKARGGVLETANEELKKSQAEWKRFYDSLYDGLTDSLYRAFEKGGSFFKSFWDGIKNLFKTTVLKLSIQGVVGGISGALGLSGAANAGQSGVGLSDLSSLSKLMGGNGGLGGMSWLTSFGANVSANITKAGEFLFKSSSDFISDIGGSLMENANSIGQFADVAGDVLGYANAALAASEGRWGAAIGSAVGTYFGGPIGAAIGNFLGGFLDAGEKETTATGIEGNFSATGFSGNRFSEWKQDGGMFHDDSSGHDISGLDSATTRQFSQAYASLQLAAASSAMALGLSADAIKTYSESISIKLTGDAEKDKAVVVKLFSDLGDHMASAVAPGLFAFAKEGETASTTLARLSGSLTAANLVMEKLRLRLFSVSVYGADAASKLVDLFGGLEQLASASQAYYEAYYSEAERTRNSLSGITTVLQGLNLAVPTSKEGFRALVESLDLSTASGRTAYATLLTLAPEFAASAEAMSRLAQETAARLMKTFTGNGQLLPALDASALKLDLLTGSIMQTGAAAGYISALFLDASSGLIGFGGGTQALTAGLTDAQASAALLNGQIMSLHLNADRTRIDFAGLSQALATVDTETFANTIALVFDNLATRIGGVIDGISAERVAVREAALQIINPTVMSKEAIQRGIAATNVNMPTNTNLVAAQRHLGYVDGLVANAKTTLASAQAQTVSTAALDAARNTLGLANNRVISAQAGVNHMRSFGNSNFNWFMDQAYAGNDLRGSVPNPSGEYYAQNAVFELLAAQAALQQPQAEYNNQLTAYDQAQAAHQAVLAPIQAYLSELTNLHLPWALQNAKNAQLAYVDSLQTYAIDASKAVSKLGKLREETVKYYEAQKQLADLMSSSAAGLRSTVADYRYSQLDPQAQFESLGAQFNTAYAMALSTSGEVLAGYGDKLNSLLNPLLEKGREIYGGTPGYAAFEATMLARAEAIAARLDALTPTNYAADSLAMLGQIDATLAALEAGSKSAEKIIADAVSAGSEKTAAGLRAVIAALTGQAIPGFAAGGDHAGGWRIVGERGPELAATGPERIFNASQTRSILSGGGGSGNTARLEALVERQAQQLERMSAELRAIAASNAKLARLAERAEVDGTLVRTDADTPLATVAA